MTSIPTLREGPRGCGYAWAAGFFDGEGATTFAPSRRTARRLPAVTLTITQCDRRTLERFRSVVGLGTIYGPYRHGVGREQFVWRAYTFADARAVLSLLWRYLSSQKREQAIKVFGAREAALRERRCRKGLHATPIGPCRECANEYQRGWRAARRVA